MSGRARCPRHSRKASQRRTEVQPSPIVTGPIEAGRPGYLAIAAQYLRDVDAGQAHMPIGARTYLVAIGSCACPGQHRVAPHAPLQQLPGALDFAVALAPGSGDRHGREADTLAAISLVHEGRPVRHARFVRALRPPATGALLPAALLQLRPAPENARPVARDNPGHPWAMPEVAFLPSDPLRSDRGTERPGGRKE